MRTRSITYLALTLVACSIVVCLALVSRMTDSATIKRHVATGPILSVQFAPNGSILASGDSSGVVAVWDTKTCVPISVEKVHTGPIRCLSFSSDGRKLASAGDDGRIVLSEAVTLRLERALVRAGRVVSRLLIGSQSSSLLSVEADRIVVWSLDSGAIRKVIPISTELLAVNMSQNEDRITVITDQGILEQWDVLTGECISKLEISCDTPVSAAFSPDGQVMAIGNLLFEVNLWRLPEKSRETTLFAQRFPVSEIRFSGDGKFLVTGTWRGTWTSPAEASVWDIGLMRKMNVLKHYHGGVTALDFERSAGMVAVAWGDNVLEFWRLIK